MNSTIFEEWFKNTLLPNITSGSVTVIDNDSYHSRLHKRIPNSSSSKQELKDFLSENDLYFEDNYNKKQLLEVFRTKTYKKQYIVNTIAIQHGHNVLRLPPYFCIFNPIELIWGQVKKRIRRKNSFPKFDAKVVDLIRYELSEITSADWKKAVNRVVKVENEYRRLGQLFSNSGQLIINLVDSDDDRARLQEKYFRQGTLT
ncbi:uncharacterized protein [Diabrotica undecimpunctata]|uniref:uncharacterized protein n=1 Tax=Diabrotica undecimpunctata TaxID=50387 RepID=UPI003B635009